GLGGQAIAFGLAPGQRLPEAVALRREALELRAQPGALRHALAADGRRVVELAAQTDDLALVPSVPLAGLVHARACLGEGVLEARAFAGGARQLGFETQDLALRACRLVLQGLDHVGGLRQLGPCRLGARGFAELLCVGPRGLERRHAARLLAALGGGGPERLGEPRPRPLRLGKGDGERRHLVRDAAGALELGGQAGTVGGGLVERAPEPLDLAGARRELGG